MAPIKAAMLNVAAQAAGRRELVGRAQQKTRLSRNYASGNHEWTRMHTNPGEIRRTGGLANPSHRLVIRPLASQDFFFIRVPSCPFVVQLNCLANRASKQYRRKQTKE